MKCLSLWQPWASAIAIGSKRIETRCWATSYRGPLLIHAAKRCRVGELRELEQQNIWRGAMLPLVALNDHFKDWLPFGAIVAIADLVDCWPTYYFDSSVDLDVPRHAVGIERTRCFDWCERNMGDFGPGRFGWVLDNVRRIHPAIPYRGFQQLFEVPDSLLAEHGVLTGATA
ncbi:MAG: ASCH domain-containing protein [Phycisphaerales bacterium]|nr:ASCH domain-containing protein [Phycisphaerales bacterium]